MSLTQNLSYTFFAQLNFCSSLSNEALIKPYYLMIIAHHYLIAHLYLMSPYCQLQNCISIFLPQWLFNIYGIKYADLISIFLVFKVHISFLGSVLRRVICYGLYFKLSGYVVLVV